MKKNLRGFYANPKLSLIAFLLLIGISCTKEEQNLSPAVDNQEALIQYLESTGFDRKDIVFEKDHFIIEDDIIISKVEVKKYLTKKYTSISNGRVEHYRGYLVSNTYVTNIKIFIEAGVPDAWKTAVRGAIIQWNGVTGTKLFFSEVTSSTSANIRVTTGYADANWIARAYLPSSNGRPGSSVTINTKFNSLDSGRKLFTIVHEVGHTFGLYHTDQTQGTFIQGTPSRDASSVMNSVVLPWKGFTNGDLAAVRIIYPE